MSISLRGPSPVTLTAGILLLSRARSFGIPVQVEIQGDPNTITPVLGPALVHAPVLATCGVGRELGQGALVAVPGPASDPMLMCLAPAGAGEWFQVDASGEGSHPATQAFVALARHPSLVARQAARQFHRLLHALGVPGEPAVLDLLFNAPAPPLTRVALAIRAGQAMTGESGIGITRWLRPTLNPPDPLPSGLSGVELMALWRAGDLDALIDRLIVRGAMDVNRWLEAIETLAPEMPALLDLVAELADLYAFLSLLPAGGMIPPPDAAADSVATGLGRVLGAAGGDVDANRSLCSVFHFLGGHFTASSPYAIALEGPPAPEGRLAIWKWFCQGVQDAADHADLLWRRVIDLDS
jgi:hypothetical protein